MSFQVETDFLIVGTGPAGGSLAAFLGQNGISYLTLPTHASIE
jgi:flavin-dependent dehydrogenase